MREKGFNEILDIVIEKITEQGIAEQREDVPEVDSLIASKVELSVKVKEILEKLDDESAEILTHYYELAEEIADLQIKYLYLQGATDCVQLLRRLNIIR